MTAQSVASALRRERRRNATPLDPRRSPEALASGLPPAGDSTAAEPIDPEAAETTSEAGQEHGGIAHGVAVLRAALRNVPSTPGVYRMLDRKGDALYVGKARNLKNRVQNYTHPAGLSNRIRRMVAETASFEIVETATEAEALLLECNLIKRLMPRYNVLLRDDKSFPFIHLTAGHEFPQLTKFRGARDKPGVLFRAVRLGRRGQPHAWSRCRRRSCCARAATASSTTAPAPACCTRSSAAARPASAGSSGDDYARLIEQAQLFLSGRSSDIQQRLAAEMDRAAEALDFEAAALIRDRIRALSLVQGHQDIHVPGLVRRRRHRGASGRRSYLRAGLLFPRRA